MADGARNDITVNGGGTIAPGTYENVTINGGGTVTGDLVCTALRINGAGTCQGSVKAAVLTVNGTGNFSGPVQAVDMSVYGNSNVRAGLGVGRLSVRGNLSIDGGVALHELDLKGVMRADGDLSARTVRGEGTIEAHDVKADSFDFAIYGSSKVRNLEADRVTLRSPGSFADVFMFFTEKRFTAETIRASEVWAEYTTANVVSAGNATIGRESRIGLVNYSGTCSVVDNAQVTESRKAEPQA
ncbi:MAG TPA: hypothetical protein VLA05_01850 [Coriobacteriia bacterium]|nr:hypothetical protein [Coriobacteriia bacterium]